jgi:hypothetical protein
VTDRVPRRDSPALRYSRKRPSQAGAYTGVVACVLAAAAGAYLMFGLSLQLRASAGTVALTAALSLFWVALFGFAAARFLAVTRPWWILEIRGSVYLEHRQYGQRRCYDLATASRAVARVWNGGPESVRLYGLRLHLEFGDRRAAIGVSTDAARLDRRSRDGTRRALALADALAEHPDPAVAREAVDTLRWFATASVHDLIRWREADRAARDRKR